jgi:hypothetical protein
MGADGFDVGIHFAAERAEVYRAEVGGPIKIQ